MWIFWVWHCNGKLPHNRPHVHAHAHNAQKTQAHVHTHTHAHTHPPQNSSF